MESDDGDLSLMPISSLLPADSPRLEGENADHARLLAESETELPPILVHRRTLRVIDGMHRVRAALIRGEQVVRVRLFDGTEEAAFVEAVRTNIVHGLPLSLTDRQSAAIRILQSFPEWSNRAVASVTGLSGTTVGAIRKRICGDGPPVTARIGRDGRIRPLDCTAGRQRASEVLRLRPDATLREVAKAAGISLGTARDVRERLRRGESPVPAGRRRGTGNPGEPATRPTAGTRAEPTRDRLTILRNLQRDPSLRFNDSGRNLLRWLDSWAAGASGWEQFADTMPPHCAYGVADFARAIADEWLQVADQLLQRAEAAG